MSLASLGCSGRPGQNSHSGSLQRGSSHELHAGHQYASQRADRVESPWQREQYGRLRFTVTVVTSSQAIALRPFFATNESSLSEAPLGCFSPRSHCVTTLGLTLR